ncbi:S-layer homology domain-containing protein [Anoxybacillus sp. D401a]|uniref:S-layer homology domain-containing protein n=1 Tax=Anoxybacillus sp. D401a TaxID=575112 RepID=UPI003D33BB73
MAYQPKSYRKFLAGTVSAAVVASAIAPVASASFTDVAGSVHADDIATLVAKGYIKGYSDGTFKPDKSLTRGEAAIIFSRILKDAGVTEKGAGFPDVPASKAELAEAVAIVQAAGIMTGDEKGNFNPNANITREQMAKVVAEAFKLTKPANHTTKVTDLDKAGAWAREYIQVLEANGVTKNTEFMPKQNVTRGQFASFVVRAMGVKPVTKEFAVSEVRFVGLNKVVVKFNQPVDEVKAENFVIPGATVVAATLSADKLSAELSVQGVELGKDYAVKVTGVKVNGVVQKDLEKSATAPSQNELYKPIVTTKDAVLKSDGASTTLVTFELRDAAGNVLKDAKNVEVAFTSTFGKFAEKRVTVQNGVATVLFTSEALTSDKVAEITAQVVEASDKTQIGLKAVTSIILSPNPSNVDITTGAMMTEAEAFQADRVVVYFNKPVKVDDFIQGGTGASAFAVNTNKADVKVYDQVSNNGTGGILKSVRGLAPVPGNDRALYVILEKSSALTDNTNIKVEFTDKRGTVAVPSTKVFKLTDARQPAMLNVVREGLKTIKVEFSEPVDETTAKDPKNWVVDGKLLSDNVYGVGTSKAQISVGDFDLKTGSDTRHVVTITLGKDADGKQIYFKPGKHSVQAANIGDWAYDTDKSNVMNTQTLEFDIPEDNTVPTATVEVQSPEQYLLVFDKELNETVASIQSALELQKYNAQTGKWEKVSDPGFVVTQMSDAKYLVELTKDWTEVYNTAGTNKNYYNDQYRLFIDKDKVSAAANGKKNAEIALTLGGAMTAPDFTSPSIVNIEQKDGLYHVTMSEPVKIPGVNNEGNTLAQGQMNVPMPTAEFVKKDKSETVPATVISGFADAEDRVIKVSPSKELSGGEWTLVVRSISDDVGNTAPSATKDFTVDKPVAKTAFKVVWAAANFEESLDIDAVDSDLQYDYVFVKFSKPIATTGDFKNVLKTANYTLNGKELPTGTQILANIKDFDDKDDYIDSITIKLPQGAITKPETTVINVSQYLESADGEVITNPGEKKLPFNFGTTVEVSTLDALKKALADDTVRKVKLSGDVVGDIVVSRVVDIDLGGNTLTGNVTVKTSEGGVIHLTGGTVDGNLTVDAPNADFVNGATVTGTTTIKDVLSKTFTNNGTLNKVVIEDANGAGFKNAATASLGEVVIKTSANVTLEGKIPTVVVEQEGAKLTVNGEVNALNVRAKNVEVSKGAAAVITNIGGTEEAKTTLKVKQGNENVNVVVDTVAPKFLSAKATTSGGDVVAVITDGKTAAVDVSGLADDVTFTGVVLQADNDADKLVFSIPGVEGQKTVTFLDGSATFSPKSMGAPDDDVRLGTLRALGSSVTISGTLYDKAGNATAVTITIKLK